MKKKGKIELTLFIGMLICGFVGFALSDLFLETMWLLLLAGLAYVLSKDRL